MSYDKPNPADNPADPADPAEEKTQKSETLKK